MIGLEKLDLQIWFALFLLFSSVISFVVSRFFIRRAKNAGTAEDDIQSLKWALRFANYAIAALLSSNLIFIFRFIISISYVFNFDVNLK